MQIWIGIGDHSEQQLHRLDFTAGTIPTRPKRAIRTLQVSCRFGTSCSGRTICQRIGGRLLLGPQHQFPAAWLDSCCSPSGENKSRPYRSSEITTLDRRRRSVRLRFLGAVLAMTVAAPAMAGDCVPPAIGDRVMHLEGRVVAIWYPTTVPPTQYACGSARRYRSGDR